MLIIKKSLLTEGSPERIVELPPKSCVVPGTLVERVHRTAYMYQTVCVLLFADVASNLQSVTKTVRDYCAGAKPLVPDLTDLSVTYLVFALENWPENDQHKSLITIFPGLETATYLSFSSHRPELLTNHV